jgi:hypothetical protein
MLATVFIRPIEKELYITIRMHCSYNEVPAHLGEQHIVSLSHISRGFSHARPLRWAGGLIKLYPRPFANFNIEAEKLIAR